jgi:hypothetical protein
VARLNGAEHDGEITAFPLCWPAGRPRHQGERQRAKWGRRRQAAGMNWKTLESLSVAEAITRLTEEIERMGGASKLVVSTNVPVKRDGLPYSNERVVDSDPGVAVYFKRSGKPYCLACDKWDRVADNVASIAAHIEAMRGIDRWGCGTIEQAFTGYLALADFSVDWRQTFPKCRTWSEVEASYARLAKELHPDVGGDHGAMVSLNRARDAARDELCR